MTYRLQSYLGYSYPSQLADLVTKGWPRDKLDTLPSEGVLRLFVDVAFHASLLREEQRPVAFRLLLAHPGQFGEKLGPPVGLAPVELSRRRAFNEQEIRRLSTAADFFRSLIGVWGSEGEPLKIWGMVFSGTRWLNGVNGGRHLARPLPSCLQVQAPAPGQLTVFVGHQRIATLNNGKVETNAFDLFQSKWLAAAFSQTQKDFEALFHRIEDHSGQTTVHADFLRQLVKNMVRRTLSVVRNSKHGGTLVFIERSEEEHFVQEGGPIRFKYQFAGRRARCHYQELLEMTVARLAHLAREKKVVSPGWNEYQSFVDRQLAELDEAMFEFAHFLADLMSTDGALILTKRMELVGFGAELRAEAPELKTVRRALDVEASIWVNEAIDAVGTRHRSVYRLCSQSPESVGVVVSQDSTVLFVKKHNGVVTCWNQLFS